MRGVLNQQPGRATGAVSARVSLRALVPPALAAALVAAAGALGVPAPAFAGGPSAATTYALNCMGCHASPKTHDYDAGPLRGEFFDSDKGRNFFIRMPQQGRVLSPAEDARLLEEILTWKRSCAAILQNAPMVEYRGE